MRKYTLLFIIFLFFIFSLPAEELDGRYDLSPFLARLTDGRLIHPDKAYAYQYSGIVGIDFLEGSFARIFTVDGEYDAFYNILPGDSDNLLIEFRLKNNADFTLELVQEKTDLFRYYYEFTDPPFSAPQPEEPVEEEVPEIEPGTGLMLEQKPMSPAETDPDVVEESGNEKESATTKRLYTGIMRKQKED